MGSSPIFGSSFNPNTLIISRPQTNTLISFSFFILITVAVATMNVVVVIKGQLVAWYNYLVLIVLIPIGLFVVFRIFIQYKILRLGGNQIQIDYPVLRKSQKYSIEEIVKWRENKVKTGKNSEYKEVEILFSDRNKLSISHKEHTEYPRIVQYLTQKASKKREISG
ncbi:MAG: hypothetical protein HYR67_15445 [Bacteroidetes bacterium]|nr:hypothetical protein [Bacteroidota bacterium]